MNSEAIMPNGVLRPVRARLSANYFSLAFLYQFWFQICSLQHFPSCVSQYIVQTGRVECSYFSHASHFEFESMRSNLTLYYLVANLA